MKNYFLLFLIGLLFAVGSKEKPIFAQVAAVGQEAAEQTPVKVTEGFLGKEQLKTIEVGECLDLSKHDVLALWYNIEEIDTSEQEPIIVNRGTGVKDIQLNSKYLNIGESDNVAIWQEGEKHEDFLSRLTDKILKANDNVAGLKYKLVPLGEDSFRLEDIQFIYRRGYDWDRIVFSFVGNETSLCYDLEGV